MIQNHDPQWLRFLARRLDWLAVPNLWTFLVGLQVLGLFLSLSDANWLLHMALIPGKVMEGELWRLVSFLAIPATLSPIWMIFSAMFTYFIVSSIEAEWGEFKTTFYVLVSLVLTVIFSFAFNYPVTQNSDFFSTLFLAAAALFPNYEIRIYFFIPVKMKVLGWFALAFLAFRLFQGDWLDRLFLLTIYSNYLIFFGPTLLFRIRDWKRRRDYKAKFRS